MAGTDYRRHALAGTVLRKIAEVQMNKQAIINAAFGLLNAGMAVADGVGQTKKFQAGFKPQASQYPQTAQAQQGGMK